MGILRRVALTLLLALAPALAWAQIAPKPPITFAIDGFSLTVTQSGGDNGDVISTSDAGITCPPDCDHLYPQNASVSLSCTPDGGFTCVLSGPGECSGTTCTNIPMSQARAVTVTFNTTGIPLNASWPIIYDTDGELDTYSLDYGMALATLGDINLVGVIMGSSEDPYNTFVTSSIWDQLQQSVIDNIAVGAASGLTNVPSMTQGSRGNLIEPGSGLIDDTTPLVTAGSNLIVAQANAASPSAPLIVAVGGQLTTVASAYLQDPSIVDKVVVSWRDSPYAASGGYNTWADGWAAYVVMSRMTVVYFDKDPVTEIYPIVTKQDILDKMLDTTWRQFMYDKDWFGLPNDKCGDCPVVIGILIPDTYILATQNISVSGTTQKNIGSGSANHTVPTYQNDANGNIISVGENRDGPVSTTEFWRPITAVSGSGGGATPLWSYGFELGVDCSEFDDFNGPCGMVFEFISSQTHNGSWAVRTPHTNGNGGSWMRKYINAAGSPPGIAEAWRTQWMWFPCGMTHPITGSGLHMLQLEDRDPTLRNWGTFEGIRLDDGIAFFYPKWTRGLANTTGDPSYEPGGTSPNINPYDAQHCGRWIPHKEHIKLNTAGVADGQWELYVDDVQVYNDTTHVWRGSGQTWKITSFNFLSNTTGTLPWLPRYWIIDDLAIWDQDPGSSSNYAGPY